ncbi:MAG: PAS domain-containing sensor histidine kinase [Candidatus Gastranaerophilales bacterium]|nr:PAS domain-containing sensor histidine kinase [Candidatus Gastranaerophilales bacterium]MCM1073017.1 PAS domain-containing sensor histidine kinase [Bacteroides sp.]
MDIKKILFRTNSIDVEKALPDAVVFCSRDGKIQWVNDKAAEIFETSKMHLLTSNISDFIENALNLITSSVIMNNQVITKLVGSETYFDMTSKEIEEGYVLDFRDSVNSADEIAKNSEDDYKEINRDKNSFLLKLANELKSPLQSIVGFSQAMADGLGGSMSEQQDKYIRIIKKNSSELMYFITKLLELSQTEAELTNPEIKTFDITSTVNSVVRFNEQLYKDKDLKWNVTSEEGLKKTIASDEEIIKTILQNIMEVILKSVDMGEISVRLSAPDEEFLNSKNLSGNYTLISVSSSSLLLSENDLESMFDPYMIVDTSNKKNVLRAMTLACVKNLVQNLRGVVWVESQILKNTSFNILIPQEG